nr:putative N-acetylmuramoyl-L-alanine amidase [uncultured bacterium]
MKRLLQNIVLHHSACENTFESIRAGHLRRGWSDVFYHYVIDRNGRIHEGRNINRASGRRLNSIEICIIGRLHIRNIFPVQHESLLTLLGIIKKNIGIFPIFSHNFFDRTICPGNLDIKPYIEFMQRKEEVMTIPKDYAQSWKDEIMGRAEEHMLIVKAGHEPDEVAQKWFVLAVANRIVERIINLERGK